MVFAISSSFSVMFDSRFFVIDFLFPEEIAKTLSMLNWYIGGWLGVTKMETFPFTCTETGDSRK